MSTVTAVATSIGVAVIGYFGYQVQANSQRAVEEIRAQTAIQQSLLNSTYQTRQLDIEMVKLALNILGGEISDKTKKSREFAVKLLQKYSGIELKDGDIIAWVDSGTVEFKLPNEALSIVTDPYSIRSEQLRELLQQKQQQK
jgi:hypothetical protein